MCGKEFKQKTHWQKFCGILCRNAHWNQKITHIVCPYCKVEIDIKKIKEQNK